MKSGPRSHRIPATTMIGITAKVVRAITCESMKCHDLRVGPHDDGRSRNCAVSLMMTTCPGSYAAKRGRPPDLSPLAPCELQPRGQACLRSTERSRVGGIGAMLDGIGARG
jgi:hypothetical protein